MKGSEHLLFGIGAGLITVYCFRSNITAPAPIVVGSALGALYPDIDVATSKLGHNVKPIASIINKLFGHRNFIHSPLNCALITWAIYHLLLYLDPANALIVTNGFMIGFLGHLVQDMCTKMGIPLFSPFIKTRQYLLPLRSDNPVCWVITILLLIGYYYLCVCLKWPYTDEIMKTIENFSAIWQQI